MLVSSRNSWPSPLDYSFSFVDYGNHDRVNQWRRMPSCDEFVGERRSKHTMVSYKGAVYVFGGDNGKSMLNDLLRFDVKEKSWVRAFSSSSQRPPARYHHSAVVHDSSMFIFGGYTGDIHSNLNLTNNNDLYEYNFQTGQWIKWVFKNRAPGPRSAHGAAVYDGKLWILAGYDGTARLNDMWTISLQSYRVRIDPQYGEIREGEWEEIEQLGDNPPTCCNFPVAVANDYMYVFSGHSGVKMTDSLFKFCFKTKRWTRISNCEILREIPLAPNRRYGHTMVAYDDNLYVFGGTAESIVPNDLHRFDLVMNTWSVVKVVDNSDIPTSRLFHAAAVDDDCMYIYGGTMDCNVRSGEIYRFKFENYPRCTLHKDLMKILDMKLFSDVEFIIGKENTVFPCHIAVITARCNWLSKKIRKQVKLNKSRSVNIDLDGQVQVRLDLEERVQVRLHDMMPEAFEMVLEYLYTDQIDPSNKSKEDEEKVLLRGETLTGYRILLIMDVYILAELMKITRLTHLCLHYIEATINLENVLTAYRVSSNLGVPLIRNLCLQFIVKGTNYEHIIFSDAFETLDKNLMVEVVRERQMPDSHLYERPILESGHSLKQDLANLLKGSDCCDITLVLKNAHIPAHKAILAARCGYFEAMFRSFMPKDNVVKIQIGEIVPSQQALDSLLQYIYSGNVSMPAEDSLYLYSASHFYSFTNNRLQSFCKENLEINVSSDNVLEILVAAKEIDAEEIKNYALDLIASNFIAISKLPKLRTLSHPLLLDILAAISDHMKDPLRNRRDAFENLLFNR